MSNVTKKNLVEMISNRTGLTQVDTKIIVENLLETISRFLQTGKNIEIRGFGRFKVKKKKSRIARNPRTGATVQVVEGFKPVFEASKELKKRVNDKVTSGENASSLTSPAEQNSAKPGEPIY
ncbi:MAG: hypothetical protein A2293_16140 [Elusimicrobia bacterium RIFOXYB2_FULL_49_7]|nr:MAG: hypothetical protein A2293_16140 [Elusimicrobia bacterium RIFOXYB2_FULL_49_7]